MSDTQFGKCPRCAGCGQIANSDDGEPWTYWEQLPGLCAARGLSVVRRKRARHDERGGHAVSETNESYHEQLTVAARIARQSLAQIMSRKNDISFEVWALAVNAESADTALALETCETKFGS